MFFFVELWRVERLKVSLCIVLLFIVSYSSLAQYCTVRTMCCVAKARRQDRSTEGRSNLEFSPDVDDSLSFL
jgi:hypothetical protein